MNDLQLVGPQEFGVDPEISIDLLQKKERCPEEYFPVKFPHKPYSHFLSHFLKLTKMENTIYKLEYVFQLMTKYLSPSKDIYIDADNLQALIRYIVVQSRMPKILIDILMCNEFTPDSIKITNRVYYINLIEEAFIFLEKLTPDQISSMRSE